MIKRLTWFIGGVAAGAAGAGYAKKKAKQAASQLTPNNVARKAASKVKAKGHDVVEAMREGRQAMHAKETELRLELHGDEPAKVIVVQEIDEIRVSDNSQPGPRRSSRRGRRGP